MKRNLCLFFSCLFFLFITPVHASDWDNHWAKAYINNAMEKGYAAGVEEGVFEPDRNIKRCEFISLLIKYYNIQSTSLITSFNDIPFEAWYFRDVSTAEEYGIVKGFDDGGFHPDEYVSRQDAVTFICRTYNINPPEEIFFMPFLDFDTTSDYAKSYVAYSVNNNLLSGYENNTLKPLSSITRAEAIVLLESFLKISDQFSYVPQFQEGYPKISYKNAHKVISVDIKTTGPCNVYYKSVPANQYLSYVSPAKKEINTFLASIPNADTVVNSKLFLDFNDVNYNLFFLAVSDNGSSGDIKKIKDFKALSYSQGDGSLNNPYIISSENQLDYMRYSQNNHFKLANDIYLSKDWTPIDASDGYFGSLDGNGHTIYNLKINSHNQNSGFFSVLKNGTIKNLTISGDVHGKTNTGIFAGKLENGLISNCVSIGTVKSTSHNAGGLVGVNNGTIKNCVSSLYSVSATTNAGGISGSGTGKILSSISAALSVSADMYAGGISGINNGGEIKDCLCASLVVENLFTYNSGTITTNKEGGKTSNNYSYLRMESSSKDASSDSNNENGMSVSLNEILSRDLYISKLKWDIYKNWKFPDINKTQFLLPRPSSFNDISVIKGSSPYSPIKISKKDDLLFLNPNHHYILTNNIYYNDEWKLENMTFNGSFNGNGYSIHGITIPYKENKNSYSLFGDIENGIILNLSLKDVYIEGTDSVGVISNSNYGIIENCDVLGKITANQLKTPLSCGTICSENFGFIENCSSSVNLNINASSATVGGIASHNEGFINNSSYEGNILITTKASQSSTATGGIVGLNNEGYIYNSSSNSQIDVNSFLGYTGGICGILNSGEIYKVSSLGNIKTTSKNSLVSSLYTGGICGLSQSGLIFNTIAASNIETKSNINYSGGISGYNSLCIIQNSYTINSITQSSDLKEDLKLYSGGICAFNEEGFIQGNVAINPFISSLGIIKRISNSKDEFLSDNYAYSNMIKQLSNKFDSQNGESVLIEDLYNEEFFSTPIYMGGKLGWSFDNKNSDSFIWTHSPSGKTIYKFPVLKDVKYQNNLKMPYYSK